MKNLKLKLRLSLCLLIVCFSTFAQTDSHDCEIVVTRADLEKCATYKRQNEFLEKEIKFQAVEAASLKDTLKAQNKIISTLKKTNKELNDSLNFWKKVGTTASIIVILLILLIAFGPKIIAKLSVLIFVSSVGFAQPDYRPPFTLNTQKGLNQKIVYDTTSNKFSIESANDIHTLKIPNDIVRKPSISAWSTGRDIAFKILESHPKIIFIVKDSVNVTLPTPSKQLMYEIYYLGMRGGYGNEKFQSYDSTSRLSFSDTINFYNPKNQITYYTKVFDHQSIWPFKLKPFSRFGLVAQKNKWYLTLQDFDY